MVSSTNTLEIFPFQEDNIWYEIVPDKYEAEYSSNIYPRPKSVIQQCFDNKFIKRDTQQLSGCLVLNQAWQQFDRKLDGYNYNTKLPHKHYDNMECQFIDFSLKTEPDGRIVVVVHTYYTIRNTYSETINCQYGLFKNSQNEYIINNEYMEELGIETLLQHFLKAYSIIDFKVIFEFDKPFETLELLYH